MLVDPILESLGARHHAGEPIAAVGGLGGGKQLAPAADESAMIPKATAGTIGSSGAEAGVAGDAPKSGAAKPVAAEEQTAPPEASPGWSDPLSDHGAPQWCLNLRWKRSSVLNLDSNLPESLASAVTRWWLSRRTPPGR